MAQEILCIGGPLDGQYWPASSPPVADEAVNHKFDDLEFTVSCNLPRVHYTREYLQVVGKYFPFYLDPRVPLETAVNWLLSTYAKKNRIQEI